MSGFSAWSWVLEAADAAADWQVVPIDVDLSNAVTLVVSAAAEITRRAADDVNDVVWSHHHELSVNWRIEDSLDQKNWFAIADSWLYSNRGSNISRISAPLGSRARLRYRLPVLIANVRRDDGSTQSRDLCQECGFGHQELSVSEFTVNLGARTL